jgi:hypothetical protein
MLFKRIYLALSKQSREQDQGHAIKGVDVLAAGAGKQADAQALGFNTAGTVERLFQSQVAVDGGGGEFAELNLIVFVLKGHYITCRSQADGAGVGHPLTAAERQLLSGALNITGFAKYLARHGDNLVRANHQGRGLVVGRFAGNRAGLAGGETARHGCWWLARGSCFSKIGCHLGKRQRQFCEHLTAVDRGRGKHQQGLGIAHRLLNFCNFLLTVCMSTHNMRPLC